jgi:hypothetical protein
MCITLENKSCALAQELQLEKADEVSRSPRQSHQSAARDPLSNPCHPSLPLPTPRGRKKTTPPLSRSEYGRNKFWEIWNERLEHSDHKHSLIEEEFIKSVPIFLDTRLGHLPIIPADFPRRGACAEN